MCEVTPKCKNASDFWVMTRREIEIPASEHVPTGTKSGRNLMACSQHLSRAVRDLNKMNREATEMHAPATDGVIVKVGQKCPCGEHKIWA